MSTAVFTALPTRQRDVFQGGQHRDQVERLEELLQEGIDSGESTEMTPEEWDEIRAEVRRIHAERRAR